MGVSYEWDIEEVDENGDVQDHDCRAHLTDFGISPVIDGERYQLVLVRNVGNDSDGLTERDWAYAERHNGRWVLPEHFEGGKPVPQRYHEELAKL